MAKTQLDMFQGTLDVLVLRALSNGPQHGYAIARFIREGSNDTFKVLDGALYTALHRMEERGWLTSDWGNASTGKRAKFYKLTPSGRKALKQQGTVWDQYAKAVSSVMRSTPEKA
jgi:PadR family transcriptional regulator, regulatory protein PadR